MQGIASKVLMWAARFSYSRRSSSSLAVPFLGPILTHTRPLYLTGGNCEGYTSATTTSPLGSVIFWTLIDGCGWILPSVRMAAMFLSNSSVTWMGRTSPLSFAPIIKYPGRLLFGKSLAKAQIACPNLSVLLVEIVRSTLSFSKSLNNFCISSAVTAISVFIWFPPAIVC